MTKIASFLSKPFWNMNKKSVWEEKCCLLFSNTSFRFRHMYKLAKWWCRTLNQILLKYDEKVEKGIGSAGLIHRSQVAGHRSNLQVTGRRLQVAGHRSQVASRRWQITGYEFNQLSLNCFFLFPCSARGKNKSCLLFKTRFSHIQLSHSNKQILFNSFVQRLKV